MLLKLIKLSQLMGHPSWRLRHPAHVRCQSGGRRAAGGSYRGRVVLVVSLVVAVVVRLVVFLKVALVVGDVVRVVFGLHI